MLDSLGKVLNKMMMEASSSNKRPYLFHKSG